MSIKALHPRHQSGERSFKVALVCHVDDKVEGVAAPFRGLHGSS